MSYAEQEADGSNQMKRIAELQRELDALKLDTQNDWRRIQDAERELEAVKENTDVLRALVRWAYPHLEDLRARCVIGKGISDWLELAQKALEAK